MFSHLLTQASQWFYVTVKFIDTTTNKVYAEVYEVMDLTPENWTVSKVQKWVYLNYKSLVNRNTEITIQFATLEYDPSASSEE